MMSTKTTPLSVNDCHAAALHLLVQHGAKHLRLYIELDQLVSIFSLLLQQEAERLVNPDMAEIMSSSHKAMSQPNLASRPLKVRL